MPSKIPSKRIRILIVALSGLILSAVILLYLLPKNSIQNDSTLAINDVTATQNPEKARLGLPVHLKIPKINIDASVEYVGVTPDGAMDVPKDITHVGWFDLGPRPGENGSSVIAGHYGWKNNMPSVFDNLYKLHKGDKIYIEDDKGATISFVVRASRRYDPKENASDVFDSPDGKPHLNLITCEGVWNNVFKSYSKRLVVFTDKE